MMISPRLLAALGLVALILAALAGAFASGRRWERATWLERERAAAADAREYALEDQRRATRFIERNTASAERSRALAEQLQMEVARARHPLVLAAAPLVAPAQADADLRLTAHGLRLWDSALASRYVPAGACGADDPAAAACAAATAVTVADAWSNHIENARRCAITSARYQRLIEFLQSRSPETAQ